MSHPTHYGSFWRRKKIQLLKHYILRHFDQNTPHLPLTEPVQQISNRNIGISIGQFYHNIGALDIGLKPGMGRSSNK